MAENIVAQAFQTLRGVLAKSAQPDKMEPGPGDVGPTTEVKQQPGMADPSGKPQLVTMEMPADQVGEWWQRIERARARVRAREDKWDMLLKEYLPIVTASGQPETVKVMQHFRNVHSKLGNMFYRSPDLILTPKEPSPLGTTMPNPASQPGQDPLPPLSMEDIVSVKQAVLDLKLGREGIKVNRLMDELLFDVLTWTGVGCSKLGYRCVYKMVPGQVQTPLAAAGATQGAVLGINQAPAQQSVPVPVFEEWYWRRFSPKKALWNDDLRSTRFDEDATWMGMEFFLSPKAAMKQLGLTADEVAKCVDDDRVHKYDEDGKGAQAPGLVHGVEITLKASYFSDEVHPEVMYQLILIEGIKDRAIVYRLSPDQTLDPTTGQLSKDSLRGFPIRVLTIRDLADSSFPMADTAFTNSEIKQLSTWRRQSVAIRDAAIGKYLYDLGAFDEDERKKLESAEVGVFVGVTSGLLANGADKIVTTMAQIHQTQDDYRGQQLLQHDIDETLGISAWGAGAQSDTVRTATEVANVQTNMQGRNDKELSRVLDFYLDGARMIDTLLMRYADVQDYIEITGTDGAKKMMVWNNQLISGKFLYAIAPDSAVKMDTAKDFQLTAQYWNLVAKSPLTNQEYILRKFARMRGFDPNKAVKPAATMEKPPPDKPKIAFSFTGEDLANPLVVAILVGNGIIPPQAVALNQPPPPEGAADKADTLSAHVQSNSGNRPNEPGASNHRESQQK